MSNIIKLPVIAGVKITTDDQERFNLNALHKASGLGDHKRPSKWLATEPTKELIATLESQSPSEGLAQKPINSIKGGNNSGTFAHELLAISYAGWISPKFQLQVNQTFLDYKKGNLQPEQNPANLSRIDILKIAMQAEEKSIKLTAELEVTNAQVEEMTPKVEALNRIAKADGSMCITDAAKDLQMRPKDLFGWLSFNKWIYKRAGGSGWVGYQDKLQQFVLEHKVTVVSRTDGSEKVTEQVRITSKGLVKLAAIINKEAA